MSRVVSSVGVLRLWWLALGCLAAVLFILGRGVIDQHGFSTPAIGGAGPKEDALLTGRELYVKYCQMCHGAHGDGRGSAARYLRPKPRNLRTGSFRLVSSENRNPSWSDVQRVLENGMPGTSMRSYRELDAACRARLVNEVFRLRRQGLREELVQSLQEEWPDVEPYSDVVEQLLDAQLAAGPAVAAPAFGSASPGQIAAGREVFLKTTCNACHGDLGRGDADIYLTDEDGVPTRPRNLVLGELKGGRAPAAVFRRILLGIPGTPMPACRVLNGSQYVNLVHYCLSLGPHAQSPSTNYTRALAAISRGSAEPANRTPADPRGDEQE